MDKDLFLFYSLGILTILMAVINSIILLIGLIKKRIQYVEGAVIVLAAMGVPYFSALIYKMGTGAGFGKGIEAWVISGLIFMIITSVYLYYKVKKR